MIYRQVTQKGVWIMISCELMFGVIVPLLLGLGIKLLVWAIDRSPFLQRLEFIKECAYLFFLISFVYTLMLLGATTCSLPRLASADLSSIVYLIMFFVLFFCILSVI